jgi:hypothetical protein
MDDDLRKRLGIIAGALVQEVMSADLDWDEAVAALGIAAKAIASAAARATPNDAGECEEVAFQRLTEAFSQNVKVSVISSDSGNKSPVEQQEALLSQLRAVAKGTKLH